MGTGSTWRDENKQTKKFSRNCICLGFVVLSQECWPNIYIMNTFKKHELLSFLKDPALAAEPKVQGVESDLIQQLLDPTCADTNKKSRGWSHTGAGSIQKSMGWRSIAAPPTCAGSIQKLRGWSQIYSSSSYLCGLHPEVEGVESDLFQLLLPVRT